jgi:hypothetical protein
MLRLAFSTAEPGTLGRQAAMAGYRVHIHKERVSRGVIMAVGKHRLKYNTVLTPSVHVNYLEECQAEGDRLRSFQWS